MTDNPVVRVALPLYLALGIGIAAHHLWDKERKAREPHGVVLSLGDVPEGVRRMGFATSDREYLASIPEGARRVPADLLDGSLFFATPGDRRRTLADRRAVTRRAGVLTVRAHETSPDGRYVLRKFAFARNGDYDQWYLLDVPRFIRAVISVHRQTRQAWFFEIRPRAGTDPVEYGLTGKENCYSCHPTGLRKILPRDGDPEVNPRLLSEFNERIEATGRLEYGRTIRPADHGPALQECDECHNGDDRGRLHPTHYRAIRFKLEELRSMPPYAPLEADESEPLLAELRKQRGELLGIGESCDRLAPHLNAIAARTPGIPGGFEVAPCLAQETPEMVRCLLGADSWAGVLACKRAHRS